MQKITPSTIFHYVLSSILVFVVILELSSPTSIVAVYELLQPILFPIGSLIDRVVDTALIKKDHSNVTAYMALLYVTFIALYMALYVAALRKMKETVGLMCPSNTSIRGWYKFQCLTFYSWAPLLFPHGLFRLFYANDSRSGEDISRPFGQALRDYAFSKGVWTTNVLIGIFVYFVLPQNQEFLNGSFLRIPFGFELTTLFLISLQASILFDVLVLASSITMVKGEKA